MWELQVLAILKGDQEFPPFKKGGGVGCTRFYPVWGGGGA